MINNACSKIELDGKEYFKNELGIRVYDHGNGCYNLDVIHKRTEVVKPIMALYNIGDALRMAVEKTNEMGLSHDNFQYVIDDKFKVVYDN